MSRSTIAEKQTPFSQHAVETTKSRDRSLFFEVSPERQFINKMALHLFIPRGASPYHSTGPLWVHS